MKRNRLELVSGALLIVTCACNLARTWLGEKRQEQLIDEAVEKRLAESETEEE